MLYAPDLTLRDGVPRGEMAFHAPQHLHLAIHRLRRQQRHDVDAGVELPRLVFEVRGLCVGEGHLQGRDVDVARIGVIGHRMPIVTPVEPMG